MPVKKYVLSFILAVCGVWALTPFTAAAFTKIVGGQPSLFNQWPWMVALVRNGPDNYNGQFCGGSLISPTWVVTAAHCVKGEVPGNIRVVAHVLDLKNDRGQSLAVKRIIIHPKFYIVTADENEIPYNDVALVQLQKPVSTARVLSLYTGSSALVNVNATVIGWGALSEWDAQFAVYPEHLYDASLPIISNGLCKKVYGATSITDTMLCAGFSDGRSDTCIGDSGGPLVIKLNN